MGEWTGELVNEVGLTAGMLANGLPALVVPPP